MRVTHVITRLIVGGAQENTIASVLGLRKKPGMAADLISGPTAGPEGSLAPLLAPYPGLLVTLPELVRPIHPWLDAIALLRLTRRFRETKPDIVHTHSGKAGVLGRLAASRAGVRCILHTIHGPSFGPFQGFAANWMFTAAEKIAGKATTHFVTVAEAMERQYRAAGIGREGQFTRVFSGFDLAPFLNAAPNPELRLRYGLKPGDFVVGKIARLFRLKGHEDLLAAAPELIQRQPNIKFLLVGGGEWQTRFETEARARGIAGHVVFTGLVPPHEVPALVGIMDALVHLSRREGLPRALPQAMAAGKPIVAFDCDGAREVCLHDVTGFLLPPGDLGALRQHLLDLARSAELRRRLGDAGRDWARDRFSEQRMVDDLYQLYLRVRRQ